MSLMGTNVQALTAQRLFAFNSQSLFSSFEKLSTGLRINRGADDPAGLIASENLRAALSALDAESRVLVRSQQVVDTADAALGEVSNLLVEAEGLAVASANTAGMSEAEIEANQMELDSIMQSVDRIANTTSFNGDKLLDGSATVNAAGGSLDISSVMTNDLGEVEVDGETLGLADTMVGGEISLASGNLSKTVDSIRAARERVSMLRGELGSFSKDRIGSELRAKGAQFINVAQAESIIRDTDFPFQVSAAVRSDILTRSSLRMLGAINAGAGRALGLLGG